MSTLIQLKQELQKASDSEKAKIYYRFFKTGKGEYGEGDMFLGITVPQSRKIVEKYFKELSLNDIKKLLSSKIHEERLIALLILVEKYNFYLKNYKKKEISFDIYPNDIFEFYLDNTQYINNWDLVDLSADKIVGRFLYNFGAEYPVYKILLTELAKSTNLWERRIAMISTYYFIKNNDFSETIKLSEILMNDEHDLMHKAVGWMLREMGKRDVKLLEKYLDKYSHKMPRTMLRYSIEKFDEKKRKHYMNMKNKK